MGILKTEVFEEQEPHLIHLDPPMSTAQSTFLSLSFSTCEITGLYTV